MYFPADKNGTKYQRAQYWLEKAVILEASGKEALAKAAFKKAEQEEKGE